MAKDEKSKDLKSKEGSFTAELLTKKGDKELYAFALKRIPQLQNVRKSHYGHDLDNLWAEADRDYLPHRLGTKGRTAIVVDEDKGWRSQTVKLGDTNWQSDLSQSNVYVKVQTAMSILVDQNPSGVFTPTTKKYEATSELIRQLYQRSWEFAKSKAQLKLFIFNLSKYGWAAARTYPLKVTRTVRVLDSYNADDPSLNTYTEKDVIEYDDIFRENLDVRNVWMDDQARPNNPMSVKDWAWRKVYDYDEAKTLYGKYDLWKYVQRGGNTQETIGNANNTNANANSTEATGATNNENKVEAIFYESRAKDCFIVMLNQVPVCIEPLPVSDTKGSKKLSLWQTYWNLRHGESPYGIGIYESIRYDQAMLDRFRNMTIDQITMSIYKMFFYQGTSSLQDTGDIKITPGVGKQVLDPKNITWLEVPGPGKDSYIAQDMLRKDVDESSGITDPLLGQVTGKTAFEIAQAKESALKRMKNPLDNILDALNDEGYITVCLMQLLYSVPETYEIAEPELIAQYLKETGGDTDLFERTPMQDEEGQPAFDDLGMQKQNFTAKVYREFPLNLSKDEKGNLAENKDTSFFRVKPDALDWEGIISIKSQSLLSPSKQVDKAMDLEMYNVLIPLMQGIAQERAMLMQAGQPAGIDDLTGGKTAKQIIKLYDKDPKDIMPTPWLIDTAAQNQVPGQQPTQPGAGGPPPMPNQSPLFVSGGGQDTQQAPNAQPETAATGIGSFFKGMGSRIGNAFNPK